MKMKVRTVFEKFFLAERNLIETIIEQLKSVCHIEHSSHRSSLKFFSLSCRWACYLFY